MEIEKLYETYCSQGDVIYHRLSDYDDDSHYDSDYDCYVDGYDDNYSEHCDDDEYWSDD